MDENKKPELLADFWKDLSVLSQRNINLLAENIITHKQFKTLKKHFDNVIKIVKRRYNKII